MYSLFLSRIYCKFNINFAISLSIKRINCLYREVDEYSNGVSRIHFEFTLFFANSLSIHYLSHDFTVNLLGVWRIYYELNFISQIHYYSPSISQIHYKFTVFSRINFEFTIYFMILL